MAKSTTPRSTTSDRDLRALLHVPQSDLQAHVTVRLERLGFPALRPAHVEVLSLVAADSLRLSELILSVGLPKQTVRDMLDDLEHMRLVERFQDPDHGVIKRVRLGPKGKVWAAEVKRVSAQTEARWATKLGSKKMKSLRALLEELAMTVEQARDGAGGTNGHRAARRR